MKILFLDDSFNDRAWISGYGGFVIEADAANALRDEFAGLKERWGLPPDAEVKWSPKRDSEFRKRLAARGSKRCATVTGSGTTAGIAREPCSGRRNTS